MRAEVNAHPANGSPSDANSDADDKRNIIVTNAARLFDEVGYAQASMEDLAEAVNLAKPTLYHYFDSKQEILYRIHQDFVSLLVDAHRGRQHLQLRPDDQLRLVMGDILELMKTHGGYVRVFFEHHRELPEERRRDVDEFRSEYMSIVENLLRQGIEMKRFRDVDVRLTSLAVFGLCNWAYQWYRPEGRLEPREIADFFFDLLDKGLRFKE